MTPTLVHRYSIPTADALRALLDIGDCEKVDVFIVGENLVFDVIAPAEGVRSENEDFPGYTSPKENGISALDHDSGISQDVEESGVPPAEPSGQKPGGAAQAQAGEKPDFPADEQSGETSPDVDEQPESELKGGPLARRAAMMCQERGFWTFSETESTEEAADWLREICGVTSRAMLDHDERAAREFDRIDGRYRRWIAGYDD